MNQALSCKYEVLKVLDMGGGVKRKMLLHEQTLRKWKEKTIKPFLWLKTHWQGPF